MEYELVQSALNERHAIPSRDALHLVVEPGPDFRALAGNEGYVGARGLKISLLADHEGPRLYAKTRVCSARDVNGAEE